MSGTDHTPAVTRRRLLQAGALATLGAASTGSASATVPVDPTEYREAITFDRFVGVNAFVDDPIRRTTEVAGTLREYHSWHWDEGDTGDYPGYPENEMKWAPSYAADGYWNFDRYYERLAEDGVTVSPCVQRAPGWLREDEDGYNPDVPVDEVGADATDPQSYEAKAHHAFQFGARYGQTEVDRERLTLAPEQPVRSGLGLVRYFEDWNEPNRWWDGEDAEFSPAEYAAMSSAACDGHAGTMEGPTGTYGVKNADPTMNFVMGGIAGHSLEWVQALDDWYGEHRPDGEFVPDVINVHHYSQNDEDEGAPALSPEADDFRGRTEPLTSWRDEHYPDVEVWVSEFGYDTHPESPLRPPEVGNFSREQMQGIWLVRAYLAFAAAGVDRAQMYMLRDVDPEDSTQYSTSGLLTQKGEWEPKPAYNYVVTMRDALQGTTFQGAVDTGRDDLRVYEFRDRQDDSVYAVWCPTADGTSVEGYELELRERDEEIGTVRLTELADENPAGVRRNLDPTGGSVSIDATESPVFAAVHRLRCDSGGSDTVRVGDQIVCDVNADGDYRDVTGDGRVGQGDIGEFFGKQHRDAWKRPELFDFSGNGAVTHGDVVELADYVVLN